MNYMLMIYSNEQEDERQERMAGADYMKPWIAYTEALRKAGAMVSGNRLHETAKATTLRLRDGKRHVQDGPIADAKEQLGGYYVIKAATLDEALKWAAQCPAAAYGTIEVRPVYGE